METMSKNGISFSGFPTINRPNYFHTYRKGIHQIAADSISASTNKFLEQYGVSSILEALGSSVLINSARGMAEAGKFELAKGHTERFGAVGTVEHSGCVAFTVYNTMMLTGFDPSFCSFKDVVDLAVNNGYRMWKFEHTKKVLNLPVLSMNEVLLEFSKDPKVQECANLQEVEDMLGKPIGIGGSMYFVDEFIGFVGHDAPYGATRLYTLSGILDSLSRSIPVPVRVNYGKYLDDPSKTGGHYVVLVGFEGDHAVVVDSSSETGIYECPSRRFLESMVMDSDKGLTCVWNAFPLVKARNPSF